MWLGMEDKRRFQLKANGSSLDLNLFIFFGMLASSSMKILDSGFVYSPDGASTSSTATDIGDDFIRN